MATPIFANTAEQRDRLVHDALQAHFALTQMGVPHVTKDNELPMLQGRIAWLLLRLQATHEQELRRLRAELSKARDERAGSIRRERQVMPLG